MDNKLQQLILAIEGKNIKDKKEILSEFNDFKKDVLQRVQTDAELNAFRNRDAFVKGEKGDQGETGERGQDGKNGRDGKDGKDGRDGKDGYTPDTSIIVEEVLSIMPLPKDGRDGKDGKDGSPDTAEQVADKLNTLENKIDWKVLKDFDSLVSQDTLKGAISTLENQTRFLIQSNSNKGSGSGGSGGGGTWGSITGTLSDQTDLQTALDAKVPYTGATANVDLGTYDLITDTITAKSSSGLILENSAGGDVLHLGNGGGVNATAYGGWNFDGATADTIAIFGASKTLSSASTATYPSLTELAYLKGVTSSIQTQLSSKWGLTGNAGTTAGTHFIGTTDAKDLVFKTNNIEKVRIPSGGGMYIYAPNGTIPTMIIGTDNSGNTSFYNYYSSGKITFLVANARTAIEIGPKTGWGDYSITKLTGQIQLTGTTLFAGDTLLTVSGTSSFTGNATFNASSATDKPIIVKGFASQTANMQEWQNNSSTALLSVTSAGTLASYQATGAKDLINHTRNDGMTVRIRTSDGYNLWVEPGGGGQLHLGQSGGGGLSHITTLYGGETYYSHPFNSRNSLKIVGSGERYGGSTDSDFEVQITNHSITGGATTHAYCSGSIFRGTTLRGNSAAQTITDASTVRIDQAPTAGTNATITNAWALHVASGASKFGGPVQLPGYTVATLPTGKIGYCAYVTDALAPVALANVVGGGAVTVKVFYDGTNWIVQ